MSRTIDLGARLFCWIERRTDRRAATRLDRMRETMNSVGNPTWHVCILCGVRIEPGREYWRRPGDPIHKECR